MNEKKRKLLEALLFASDGVLHKDKIKRHLSLNDEQLSSLVGELSSFYESGGSGFKVSFSGDFVSLAVHDELIPSVKNFMESEFSSAVIKTLAMIAFKSPVRQSEIIKSRGNKAYAHISELVGRGLLAAEESANTRVLRLTPKFFQYFNIKEGDLQKLGK